MIAKKLSPKSARILAIHRDRSFRTLLGNVASKLNHNLQVAESAREGLTLLENKPGDIVFYDVKLPRIDGIDALDRLKSVASDAIFIAVADYTDVDKAVRAAYLGAHNFVLKPFDASNLGFIIERSLVEKDREKVTEAVISVAEDVDTGGEPDIAEFLKTIITERETLLDALSELMPLRDRYKKVNAEKSRLDEELSKANSILRQLSESSSENTSNAKKIAALEEQLHLRTEELEAIASVKEQLNADLKIAQAGVGPITKELGKVREKLNSSIEREKSLEIKASEAISLKGTAKSELKEFKAKAAEHETELARREGKNAALSAKCDRLEEEIRQLAEAKGSLSEQLAAASGEKGEVVTIIEEKQARIGELEKAVKASSARVIELQAALDKRRKDFDAFREEKEKLATEHASFSTVNSEMEKRINALEIELSHVTHERDEQKHQFDVLSGSKAEVAKELDRKERKITELSEMVVNLESKVSETSGMAKSIETMLEKTVEERDIASSQSADLERRLLNTESEWASAKEEMEKLSSGKALLEERLNSITGEKATVKQEIEKRETQIEELRGQVSELKGDLIELRRKYDEVISDRDKIRSEKSELETNVERLQTDKTLFAGFKDDKERLEKEKSSLDIKLGGVLVELEDARRRAEIAEANFGDIEKNYGVVKKDRDNFEDELLHIRRELDAVRSTGETASESLLTEIETLRSKLSEATIERRDYAEKVVDFERENEFLQKEVESLSERVRNLSIVEEKFLSELDNAKTLQESLDSFRVNLQTAETSIETLTAENKAQRVENDRLLARFEDSISRAKDLEKDISDSRRDHEDLRSRFAETALKLETAERSNDEFIKKVQSLQRLNESLSAEKSELAGTVSVMNELNARIEELESERNKLSTKITVEKTNSVRQINERDQALAELGQNLDERDRSIHELEQLIAELRSVEVDRNRISEENTTLSSEIRALKSDFEAMRGAKEFLDLRLAETEAVRNRLRQELTESDTKLRSTAISLESVNVDLKAIEDQKLSLDEKAVALMTSLDEANAELEEVKDRLKNYESSQTDRNAAKEKELELVRRTLESEIQLLQEELVNAQAKPVEEYEDDFVREESYNPGIAKTSAADEYLGAIPEDLPASIEGRLRVMTVRSNALEFALDELRDENDKLKSHKRELNFKLREKAQTDARVVGLARELESANGDTRGLRNQIKTLRNSQSRLEQDLIKAQMAKEDADIHIASLESQRQSLKRALESTRSAMESIKANLGDGSRLIKSTSVAKEKLTEIDDVEVPGSNRISKVLQRMGI